jgi:glycine/D-amino acid oxidase-like deaminating enzyme
MYETNVLIVGAGPTGLTLALDLARRGISFRLIDAAASPFAGSRGKGDGISLFDHLHGPHATEFVTPEGPRLLIRPDGYIAHIGTTHFSEYAGAPTRSIRGTLSQLRLR